MEFLTVKEYAELKGCSEQYLRQSVLSGHIESQETTTDKNRKKYLIPITELTPPLQRRYYQQRYGEVPEHLARAKVPPDVPRKTLEQFPLGQRTQIERWINILTDWRAFRAPYPNKDAADRDFLAGCRERYGDDLTISKDILYRKWAAYRRDDLAGLVDKRGQWKKGVCEAPQEIRDIFLYTYLDATALPISKCVEATERILRQERPELLPRMPSYDTFYRWSKECPGTVSTLARDGQKAFNDRYGLYVDRLYGEMVSNDYWIADGHTIDVITRAEDGSKRNHRLTLSAFIDARSGIYVGWVVTDNPSSDATLLALRKAIRRYGIPKYLYVDNGREYLNIDIGGMGHRARSRKVKVQLPTPILTRLGIQMTNALPRNAQAKIIEREFRNFTFLSRLFPTYVGSNPVVKPEKLKQNLKQGTIPTDSELTRIVEDMIEGYFNQQTYGGKVVSDRGKTRMQVYQEHRGLVRVAAEDDLNLMMMRSSRLQTIGRNGVHVLIGGEKIFYYDDELLMMQGKKVFVRYDPECMDEVRVYDEDEAFVKTAPLALNIMLDYFATKDELKKAMSEKRHLERLSRDAAQVIRERVVSQYGHINLLDLFARAARVSRYGVLAPEKTGVYELVLPEESNRLTASGETVPIDRARMIRNNERQG